jgi:hypothetical protein
MLSPSKLSSISTTPGSTTGTEVFESCRTAAVTPEFQGYLHCDIILGNKKSRGQIR